MSPSIFHQKLLEIRRLSTQAIFSDASRKDLRNLWTEVESIYATHSLQLEDRLLLAGLSYNHNALAKTMSGIELCLEDLLNDAHQEMNAHENREYRMKCWPV